MSDYCWITPTNNPLPICLYCRLLYSWRFHDRRYLHGCMLSCLFMHYSMPVHCLDMLLSLAFSHYIPVVFIDYSVFSFPYLLKCLSHEANVRILKYWIFNCYEHFHLYFGCVFPVNYHQYLTICILLLFYFMISTSRFASCSALMSFIACKLNEFSRLGISVSFQVIEKCHTIKSSVICMLTRNRGTCLD